MSSHGGSWRSGGTLCAGTFQREGRYVSVSVRERHRSHFVIVEEHAPSPGRVECGRLIGWGSDLPKALRDAEAYVLSYGGLVGAEPEAICGSPVGETLARSMFTEIGMRRFLHVPVRARPG